MPWKSRVWQDEYQALCHMKDWCQRFSPSTSSIFPPFPLCQMGTLETSLQGTDCTAGTNTVQGQSSVAGQPRRS